MLPRSQPLLNQPIDSQFNEYNDQECLFSGENALDLGILSTFGGKFSDLQFDTLVSPQQSLHVQTRDQSESDDREGTQFGSSLDYTTTRDISPYGLNEMSRRRLAHQFIRSGSGSSSGTEFYCRSPLTPSPVTESFNARLLQAIEQHSHLKGETKQLLNKLPNPSLDSLLLQHYAATDVEDNESQLLFSQPPNQIVSNNDFSSSSSSSSSSIATSTTRESSLGLHRNTPSSIVSLTTSLGSTPLYKPFTNTNKTPHSPLINPTNLPHLAPTDPSPLQSSLETTNYRSHISSTLLNQKTRIKTYLHTALRGSEAELGTRLTEFDTLKADYERLKLHVVELRGKLQRDQRAKISDFERRFMVDVETACLECAQQLRLLEERMEKCREIRDRDALILREIEGVLEVKTSCLVNKNSGLKSALLFSLRCVLGFVVDAVVFCLLVRFVIWGVLIVRV